MINFIPIFPLNLVVFPGERINLHIFEERYKQLINDIDQSKKKFGIPCILDNKIAQTGCLISLEQIVKKYPDGKLDITVLGQQVFSIIEILSEVPDKLYQGAIVAYPERIDQGKFIFKNKVLKMVRLLHDALHITKSFSKPDKELNSYDLAHAAGLSLAEEYELLELPEENQRLEYLNRHLKKVLPIVNDMEALKEKIKLNGHFRELKGW
ncbi:MAG: LON peptidase substrate-binding domain-containing protein [Bacteroidetes bacterium]|nr:LON peptidase substrate-binding domain-containing protein [Bacteroidota bacterium]